MATANISNEFGLIDQVTSSRTTYDWRIERFDVAFYAKVYNTEPDDFHGLQGPSYELINTLVSRSFLAGEEAGLKSSWHVELNYINPDFQYWEFEASLVFDEYLGDEESFKPFRCYAKISMIDPETFAIVTTFFPGLQAATVKEVGQRIILTKDEVAMYESKNKLKVKPTICLSIELEIFGENYNAPYDFPRGEKHFDSIQLQQDFGNLLNCKESSDFTIKCDGKDFSVHKTILWGRSKVFARMFSNPDFQECRENELIVTDIAQDAMEILLHFIYTGKLSELLNSDNLGGVIQGADKYELTELKDYCIQNMMHSITTENFGSLAYFATSCNAGEKVLAVLKRYYEMNVLKLMKNVEFRKLAAQHPEIIFEN